MTYDEFDEYYNDYGVDKETLYCNDIEFVLMTTQNGEVAIFKKHETLAYMQPMVIACNMSKAKDYCYKTERCPSFVQPLVERIAL